MANYALIEGYLDTLRGTVRWRRDVDDLIAEVEDHLLSAVERIEARGADRVLAQRTTLDQFGDPVVLAKAFASTPTGGFAVPTSFTRTAGLAGIWAAVLMVTTPALWTLMHWLDDRNGRFEDSSSLMWMLMTVVLMGSFGLTMVLMVGLLRRHGGLGAAGIVGIVLMGLATLVAVLAWAIPLWGGLFAAGAATYAVAMWNRGIVPKAASVALAVGMPLGIGIVALLTVLEVGWRDSYGDYPAAWMAGVWVGLIITAGGAYGLGRFLRNEEPVDLTPADQAVTT